MNSTFSYRENPFWLNIHLKIKPQASQVLELYTWKRDLFLNFLKYHFQNSMNSTFSYRENPFWLNIHLKIKPEYCCKCTCMMFIFLMWVSFTKSNRSLRQTGFTNNQGNLECPAVLEQEKNVQVKWKQLRGTRCRS